MLLFAACFNDILRIGNSKLTLFRVLAIFGFIRCLLVKKNTIKYFGILLLFTFLTFLQSIFFYSTYRIGVNFSFARYILYDYFYICIFIIVWTINLIRRYEKQRTIDMLHRFLLVISAFYFLNLMMLWIYPDIRNYILLNNQNDYGAMLAATLPIIICDYCNTKRKRYICFSFLIIVILIVMDCKLSILAVFLQLIIMFILFVRNRLNLKNTRIFIILPFFLIVVLGIIILTKSNITFHGYNIKDSVVEPVKHIIAGEMYNQNNTSVSYRVNVMIIGTQWMFKSKFLGIGIGNTGVLLRNLLGEQNLYDKWMLNDAISPHNALIEVSLEFGIFAIVLIVLAILSVIKIVKKEKLRNEEISYISFFVSSLLWLQGPSGIVTDYYIFIIFTYMILKNKQIRGLRKN